MKSKYLDALSTIFIVGVGVTMFAKLSSYNWALLGSYKGALGVIAVLGLAAMLTHARQLYSLASITIAAEYFLWLLTATTVCAGLFNRTTKIEFIIAGGMIGVSWLFQITADIRQATHSRSHRYITAG